MLSGAQAALDQLELERPLRRRRATGWRIDALPFKLGDQPAAGAVVVSLLAGPVYARVYVPASQRPQGGHSVNLGRKFAVIRKELRQLSRDRLTFGMIVGIPTLQLLLFGFAINLDIRHLPASVFDQSNSWRSRELVAKLASSQVLDFRHHVSAVQQVDSLLRGSEIEAAAVIPRDFEARLERGNQAAWQVMANGSDQSAQVAARQLASFPLSHFPRLIRGIMLRGASFGELWIELLALTAFVVVILAIAVRRFRKSLD